MTSRLTKSGVLEGKENVYAAAELWVEHALRADDSLFTPGTPIWTLSGLRELRSRFLERPAKGASSFEDNLRQHLEGSSPKVYQLMAEVMYVHFMFITTERMKGETKRGQIDAVLSLGAPISAVPDAAAKGLTPGIAFSQTFHIHRAKQFGQIIEFAEQWKEAPPAERGHRLDDPWAFKEFVNGVELRSKLLRGHERKVFAQRRALLHLVHPDTFERILADRDRAQLVKYFADLVTEETTDTDRKLEQIRSALEAEQGGDFDFYEDVFYKDVLNAPDDDEAAGEDEPQEDLTDPREADLAGLARELFLTEPGDFLHRIEKLLNDKRQVIFQGPPGTGKTFVAQELAQCLAGPDGSVTLVQMHPSYAYEDFVQGFRPTLRGGQAGFELRDGPLLQAAEAARARPDAKHFLIIDEINRGNLAKVFGELYFLLEYRDRKIRLQYQGDGEVDRARPADSDEDPELNDDRPGDRDMGFRLPRNLYFIGTMNTADRSIALVDLALRRRFYFVEFHPDAEPIKGLLRRWLEENEPEMGWVADVLDRANKLLGNDRHVAIGPSHFIKDDLDDEAVERIWTHSVLPYVEECLFGQRDRLSEFDLDALRKSGGPGTAQADGELPDEQGAPTQHDSGDGEEAEP